MTLSHRYIIQKEGNNHEKVLELYYYNVNSGIFIVHKRLQ